MTDKIQGDGPGDDRELESIFALAKPRPAPPEHVARRVRKAVHAEWHAATAGRAAQSRGRYLAIAASLVLALTVGLLFTTRGGPGASAFPEVSVARVAGQASLISASGRIGLSAESPAVSLSRGDVIETGAKGGATLEIGGGRELRIGAASRAVIDGRDRLLLESGRLYFDSGHDSASKGGIVIATELGQVRHLGTRFLVTLEPDELRVDVRDGRVEVSAPNAGARIAGPGQALVLFENGESTLGHDGAFGARWQWAEQLVPPLHIEGLSLYSVISWAARESGRTVEFASARLEMVARDTVLHGDLVLTDPIQGLSQTILTTHMDYEIRNAVIVINSRT